MYTVFVLEAVYIVYTDKPVPNQKSTKSIIILRKPFEEKAVGGGGLKSKKKVEPLLKIAFLKKKAVWEGPKKLKKKLKLFQE